MVDAQETKRRKARELRYRNPIVKSINLELANLLFNEIIMQDKIGGIENE